MLLPAGGCFTFQHVGQTGGQVFHQLVDIHTPQAGPALVDMLHLDPQPGGQVAGGIRRGHFDKLSCPGCIQVVVHQHRRQPPTVAVAEGYRVHRCGGLPVIGPLHHQPDALAVCLPFPSRVPGQFQAAGNQFGLSQGAVSPARCMNRLTAPGAGLPGGVLTSLSSRCRCSKAALISASEPFKLRRRVSSQHSSRGLL